MVNGNDARCDWECHHPKGYLIKGLQTPTIEHLCVRNSYSTQRYVMLAFNKCFSNRTRQKKLNMFMRMA